MPKAQDKAKERKPNAARIKAWLKAHGCKAQDVDAKAMSNEAEMCSAVCDLLGVTAHEYARARRKT